MFRLTLIIVTICWFCAKPALAIPYVNVSGQPSLPRPATAISQQGFHYQAAPGTVIEDGITVTNATRETKTIALYPADATIDQGGNFVCSQRYTLPKAEGLWIKLSATSIQLAAQSQEQVRFRLRVPFGAEPGEHSGCLVMQDLTHATTTVVNGIVLDTRTAMRVGVLIPGFQRRAVTIEALREESSGATLRVTTTLKNVGTISQTGTLALQLYNRHSSLAAQRLDTISLIPAAHTVHADMFRRPWWGGWYRLTAIITYHDSFSAGGGHDQTVRLNSHLFLWPTTQALLVVGIVVGVAFLSGFGYWRRRQRAIWRQPR